LGHFGRCGAGNLGRAATGREPLRKWRDQRPSNKTHPPSSIARQNDRAGTARTTQGSPPANPALRGCHVPVERRQRMGESGRPARAAFTAACGNGKLLSVTYDETALARGWGLISARAVPEDAPSRAPNHHAGIKRRNRGQVWLPSRGRNRFPNRRNHPETKSPASCSPTNGDGEHAVLFRSDLGAFMQPLPRLNGPSGG
jgi:hypothetical protein